MYFGSRSNENIVTVTPNNLSTFLTLVYRAQIELSLATNNFPSNVTLAMDHAESAAKLIDEAYYFDEDILDDTDFIRKYNQALDTSNFTIHGLVIADIVDQVLKEYGEGFDIDYDLTNMSNMMRAPDINSSLSTLLDPDSDHNSNVTINLTNQNNTLQIVNIADYQSAQKLSEKAYQIFRTNLLSIIQPSNNTSAASVMTRLEKSMVEFNHLVCDKAPAQELMMVVHGQVHPSLQSAYNLKIKQ